MKASKLMLGDWVSSRGKNEQVTSIYDGFICTDSFEDRHDYYFEPIPITAEVLEKNGFICKHRYSGNVEYWLAEDYYDVEIYEWSDSIWVARYESNEMHCPHEQLTMSYIHELQHFLKAVGIEEGIII